MVINRVLGMLTASWLITAYAFFCAVILCVVFQLGFLKKANKQNGKPLTVRHFMLVFIFLFYLMIVYRVTGMGTMWIIGRYPELIRMDEIYLMPFGTFDSIESVVPYLLNIFMTIPFGFLLPLIWREFRSGKRVVLAGFSLSLAIELSQLLNHRTTSTDDLIANTFGAIVGYLVFKRLYKLLRRKAEFKAETIHRSPILRHEAAVYLVCSFLGVFLFYNGLAIDRVIYDTSLDDVSIITNYVKETDGTASPPNSATKSDDRIIHVSEIKDTRYLELINNDYAINGESNNDLEKVSDYVWTLDSNLLMNKDALTMLQKMFDAAKSEGYSEFRVTHAYRTLEDQQALYDSMEDKSFVALPGRSEHHSGFAADISYHGVNFSNSIQGTWFGDNAYKYGFILRYPQDKEHITGFPYESWHFRYVGQPHAWYIHQNNLCLEEYIQFLKNNGGYRMTLDGKNYEVLYQTSQNGIINLPESQNYCVSGDNTGGFIVTGWGE